jgi:hypothetical protein
VSARGAPACVRCAWVRAARAGRPARAGLVLLFQDALGPAPGQRAAHVGAAVASAGSCVFPAALYPAEDIRR